VIQVLTNTSDPSFKKQVAGKVVYYFGKEVGLLKYVNDVNGDYSVWELKQIKELKE
jgi:hypothetical protein